MEENKIEIKAPFYRGLILVFTNSLCLISLGCIILSAIMIIIKKWELAGIITALYFLKLISFIAIKIYQKNSKTIILIDENEISKYKNNKIVKSIKIKDVKVMYFAKYSFPGSPFDEFRIYSTKNDRINFYARCAIVMDIEKTTKLKFERINK